MMATYPPHFFFLRKEQSPRFKHPVTLSPFNGLHCTSFLKIVEMAVVLIDGGRCEPSWEDFRGVHAAWIGGPEGT